MTDDLELEWQTLAEIDAKPGDMVVHKGPGCEMYTIGLDRWLYSHKTRKYFPFSREWDWEKKFRLISRCGEGQP